jgi:hypothetical protein
MPTITTGARVRLTEKLPDSRLTQPKLVPGDVGQIVRFWSIGKSECIVEVDFGKKGRTQVSTLILEAF